MCVGGAKIGVQGGNNLEDMECKVVLQDILRGTLSGERSLQGEQEPERILNRGGGNMILIESRRLATRCRAPDMCKDTEESHAQTRILADFHRISEAL